MFASLNSRAVNTHDEPIEIDLDDECPPSSTSAPGEAQADVLPHPPAQVPQGVVPEAGDREVPPSVHASTSGTASMGAQDFRTLLLNAQAGLPSVSGVR